MLNKKTIVIIILITVISIVFLIMLNRGINSQNKEAILNPKSGGNEKELTVKDEKLFLYKNMTTSDDYEGFKRNLRLFIANKGGKTNDTVYVVGANEKVAREPYPRYIDVNIPSLNKTYKIKIDYNEDRSKLLFIIEDENYVSDLNLIVN